MKKPSPVLLRSVNNAKASRSNAAAGTSRRRSKGTTCEQPVSNRADSAYTPTVPDLFAGIDPVVARVAHNYVDNATGADRALLDAWDKIGRADAQRRVQPYFTRTVVNTLTPLGLACLHCYWRGYEDERQAQAVAAAKEEERSSGAPNSGTTTDPQAPPQGSLDPANG
jgi:hypothetical protein